MTIKKALLVNITDDSTQTIKIHSELQKRYTDVQIISKDTAIRPQRTTIIRGILNLITAKEAEICLYICANANNAGILPEDYSEKGPLSFSQLRGLMTLIDTTSKLVVIIDINSPKQLLLQYNLSSVSKIVEEQRGDRTARCRKNFPVMTKTGLLSEIPENVIIFSDYMKIPSAAYTDGRFIGGVSFCLFAALSESNVTFLDLLNNINGKMRTNGYPQELSFSTSISNIFDIPVSNFF